MISVEMFWRCYQLFISRVESNGTGGSRSRITYAKQTILRNEECLRLIPCGQGNLTTLKLARLPINTFEATMCQHRKLRK